MNDRIEAVRKYMDTLSLIKRDKEEIENVLLGYIADCKAKDKRIAELEQSLDKIASLYEANKDVSSGHEITLLFYDARCIARQVLKANKE